MPQWWRWRILLGSRPTVKQSIETLLALHAACSLCPQPQSIHQCWLWWYHTQAVCCTSRTGNMLGGPYEQRVINVTARCLRVEILGLQVLGEHYVRGKAPCRGLGTLDVTATEVGSWWVVKASWASGHASNVFQFSTGSYWLQRTTDKNRQFTNKYAIGSAWMWPFIHIVSCSDLHILLPNISH